MAGLNLDLTDIQNLPVELQSFHHEATVHCERLRLDIQNANRGIYVGNMQIANGICYFDCALQGGTQKEVYDPSVVGCT